MAPLLFPCHLRFTLEQCDLLSAANREAVLEISRWLVLATPPQELKRSALTVNRKAFYAQHRNNFFAIENPASVA